MGAGVAGQSKWVLLFYHLCSVYQSINFSPRPKVVIFPSCVSSSPQSNLTSFNCVPPFLSYHPKYPRVPASPHPLPRTA